jgi:hypothetical protein
MMKITISIDCTPVEARLFFGLPDLQPMQDALMAQLQERLSASVQSSDVETLMRLWLPTGVPGFEQLYRVFASQLDLTLGKEKK